MSLGANNPSYDRVILDEALNHPERHMKNLDRLLDDKVLESRFDDVGEIISLQNTVATAKEFYARALHHNKPVQFPFSRDKNEYAEYDPHDKILIMHFGDLKVTYGYISEEFDRTRQTHFGVLVEQKGVKQGASVDTMFTNKWKSVNNIKKPPFKRKKQTFKEWFNEIV